MRRLAGGYQALLYYDAEATGKPAGLVKLTVATTGTFSGSLITTEYKTYPLAGKLTYTTLSDTAEVTGGLSIKRVGVGVLPLALTLSIANATQTLSVTLSGDTGVYSSPGVPVNSVSTTGFRNLTLPVRTLADFSGKYTLAMPLTVAATTGTPAGSGYATVTIGTTGLLTMIGKAGDGTAIVASLSPGPNRNYLLFLNPNLRAASYIAGKLNLTARPDAGFHISPATTGSDLQWAKVGKITDISYRSGIPNVGLLVSMEPWKTVPTLPAGQTLGSFLGLDLNEIFNLNFVGEFNTTTYAQYIPTKLELTKLNKFRVAERMLGAPSPILDTKWATIFTLSVAPTTGLITGTLKIEDSIPPTTIGRPPTTVKRTITISGVMLQLPSGDTSPFARGLVSIPPLNIKTTTTTTTAFTLDGPVTVDPYIATAAGTAGTYTTIVDRLDNGGLAYPAGIAADGATVTFIVSPDLKTLTFNGRRLSLLGDSRPVSLAYADIVSAVKLTVTLFLNGTTGNVASGNTNYFQPVFPMPRQGSNNFPKNGTFVIKR
ncbi:MAG: hypothetical protein NTV80_10535 [Verrucomicrobia bacterium]|nr:hypothetical protein [Verrucomicrobiota bacterium]